MFMNCAPIMVLGDASNTDVPEESREEKFESAPLMFEANNGNGCWTQNLGSCVEFPEPGDSFEVNPECPFNPENMFSGVCGPSRRLAILSSRWGTTSHTMLAAFVLVVTVALILSVMRVFRGKHDQRDKYEKVLQA